MSYLGIISSYKRAGIVSLPALAFISMLNSDANATSYTFNSINFGAADATRRIIVGVTTTGSTNGQVTAVTIGGVAATQVVHNGNTLNTVRQSSLWIALVPTGTTGSIVITVPGLGINCKMASWRTVNLLSATPHDTISAAQSGTIDIPADGICIGMMRSHTANDIVWAGITERGQVTSESATSGCASDLFLNAQVNRTISAIASGESAGRLAVASFR